MFSFSIQAQSFPPEKINPIDNILSPTSLVAGGKEC